MYVVSGAFLILLGAVMIATHGLALWHLRDSAEQRITPTCRQQMESAPRVAQRSAIAVRTLGCVVGAAMLIVGSLVIRGVWI